MKVLILGGGPGGLYSGLLLKKANPSHQITVLERNPPDATFGWGIVFSDRTLASLREADYKTYKEITDQFVIWEAIDVVYRKQTIRCEGHVFAGISRKTFLQILQRRCGEVGVEMKFHCDLTEFKQLKDYNYDVLIASDGLNSLVRKSYAHVFQPDLAVGKSKFVWLGAARPYDSFTYIFEENEHGLFQVHAYTFDGSTSTFIVECTEQDWRNAGLDKATEADTIAYCEQVFADNLGGAALLSNRSLWLDFITVRNRTWRHENMVLLGDAAHTAYFGIGSGTKMAMEDAIALANAFERHTEVEAALNSYELERRPVIESLQKAADESRTYFEDTRRYLHFDPMQFAFRLLTRSGRVTSDNLRIRDANYMAAVDRWYWKRAGEIDCKTPALIVPAPMLTPLRLRKLMLPNRAVLEVLSSATAAEGMPGGGHENELLRRALSGAGLVLTEVAAISPEGRITPGCGGLYAAEHQQAWAKMVEVIHRSSAAKVGLQLGHAGRRGSTRPRWEGLDRPLREGNWPLLSASAIPYSPASQTPKAMDAADMAKVRQDFARAAQRGLEAGFDLLQLHFAQGYLLASFLSPLTNRRTDDYGGSLENRMRFPLEILDDVRAVWPQERPISVAISATDWAKGGMGGADAVEIARALKEHGCDLVTVLAGQTTVDAEPSYGPGFLTSFSDRVRNEARIATMVAGQLTSTDQVNTIIPAGRADLCIMDLPL
ncbi:MAG: FAD-dependent monooxygenase [Acidobacteria bacterium]|nr:FAD-dependent monooxygenase [Acidobacteriota bacterium]